MKRDNDESARWRAADADLLAFTDSIARRREQLRALSATSNGPLLDSTPESLDAVNDWFIAQAMAHQEQDLGWDPRWLHHGTRGRIVSPAQKPIPVKVPQLRELVAVYFADVCLTHDPTMQWVCWRSHTQFHSTQRTFVLDQGFARIPLCPFTSANVGIEVAIMRDEFRPDSYYGPPRRGHLHREFLRWRDQREKWLEIEPRSWQAAPTGEKANTRIPHHPGDFGQNHLP